MGWKLELVETGPATRACRMKVAWLGEIAAAAGTPRSSAPIRAAALAPLRLCRHAPGEGRVSSTCHGALGCGFRRKPAGYSDVKPAGKLGRASGRERVWPYV